MRRSESSRRSCSSCRLSSFSFTVPGRAATLESCRKTHPRSSLPAVAFGSELTLETHPFLDRPRDRRAGRTAPRPRCRPAPVRMEGRRPRRPDRRHADRARPEVRLPRNAAHGRRTPTKSIVFRNLGWSGDTVFGHARAGFGTPVDGFKQLKEHVLGLKPTVLIVGYGMAESFDGEAGPAGVRLGSERAARRRRADEGPPRPALADRPRGPRPPPARPGAAQRRPGTVPRRDQEGRRGTLGVVRRPVRTGRLRSRLRHRPLDRQRHSPHRLRLLVPRVGASTWTSAA